MARGKIFRISTSPENIAGFSEIDVYDDINSLNVDFVRDRDDDEALDDISNLKNLLKKAGFCVRDTAVTDETTIEECSFMFVTGDKEALKECLRKYFGGFWELLKKEVDAMTIDDFIQPESTYELQCLIDDRTHDVVYFDTGYTPGLYTFMGFMRRLEPDTRYYVSEKTVLMH